MAEPSDKSKPIATPTYSMPQDLAEAVRLVAKEEQVPASQIVRAALRKYAPVVKALKAVRSSAEVAA